MVPATARELSTSVRGPLADRGQGPGAGQHGGHRHGHRAQRVPPAAALSGVGELGEVIEQILALVGYQRSAHGQPLGNRCNGG
jgi:hypothetical protein